MLHDLNLYYRMFRLAYGPVPALCYAVSTLHWLIKTDLSIEKAGRDLEIPK
jgi:hypothetical protein